MEHVRIVPPYRVSPGVTLESMGQHPKYLNTKRFPLMKSAALVTLSASALAGWVRSALSLTPPGVSSMHVDAKRSKVRIIGR